MVKKAINGSVTQKRILSKARQQRVNINNDPNWQVKTFTDIFLNIMSNFIPIETKRFLPCDPPWINKPLKTLLNKKNRLLKIIRNLVKRRT